MTENAALRNSPSLGSRLKEARNDASLSIRKLARELDVDQRTVARWESGEAAPSVERLLAIARILQKPASYFLDEVAA